MRSTRFTLTRVATAIAFSAVALAVAVPTAGALPIDPLPPSPSPTTPAPTPPAPDPTCGTPVGTPGAISALSFGKRNWPLSGGLHMDTQATINRNNGAVSGTVHLYNSYWGMGYTGAVKVVLRDRCGNTIATTTSRQWNVDAKALPWGTSERWVAYNASVSPSVANRVASAEAVHTRVG